MDIRKVAAALLVEDFSIYPRNTVDDTHVNELARAAASGATFPPIVAEKGSNRIVDGVHRRRQAIKVGGQDAVVDVEFREYPNEAKLFLDAVRLNAQHGRRLDRQDQTRIVLRLQELKVEPIVIASTLHVPEQEVKTLTMRVVYDTGGNVLPQKRGFEHMRGKTLSNDQVLTMRTVRSGEVGRLCRELTSILDKEMFDYSDEKVEQQLRELARTVTLALKRIREQNPKRKATA